MFHILKEDITSYCQPCPLYLINVIPLFLVLLTVNNTTIQYYSTSAKSSIALR